jgi:hypothetical protein
MTGNATSIWPSRKPEDFLVEDLRVGAMPESYPFRRPL